MQAIEQSDLPAKINHIDKSIQILSEGLQLHLDTEAGGDLAKNLDAVYGFCILRLIQANLKNDVTIVREVHQIIEPLVVAWKSSQPNADDMSCRAVGSQHTYAQGHGQFVKFCNSHIAGANTYASLISEEYDMSQQLIDYYKAIEDSSRQMLDAAKSEDWDQVVRYEGVCALLIEQLRELAQGVTLKPDQRAEKTRIMQRILSNDAQIRYLAEPWLNHFEPNLGVQHQYLH